MQGGLRGCDGGKKGNGGKRANGKSKEGILKNLITRSGQVRARLIRYGMPLLLVMVRHLTNQVSKRVSPMWQRSGFRRGLVAVTTLLVIAAIVGVVGMLSRGEVPGEQTVAEVTEVLGGVASLGKDIADVPKAAVKDAGKAFEPDEVEAGQGPEPVRITKSESTDTSITIYWTEPNTNGSVIDGWQVEHRPASQPDGWVNHHLQNYLGHDVRQFTVTGLEPDTKYDLNVKAVVGTFFRGGYIFYTGTEPTRTVATPEPTATPTPASVALVIVSKDFKQSSDGGPYTKEVIKDGAYQVQENKGSGGWFDIKAVMNQDQPAATEFTLHIDGYGSNPATYDYDFESWKPRGTLFTVPQGASESETQRVKIIPRCDHEVEGDEMLSIKFVNQARSLESNAILVNIIDNCVRNLPAATPEPTATPTPASVALVIVSKDFKQSSDGGPYTKEVIKDGAYQVQENKGSGGWFDIKAVMNQDQPAATEFTLHIDGYGSNPATYDYDFESWKPRGTLFTVPQGASESETQRVKIIPRCDHEVEGDEMLSIKFVNQARSLESNAILVNIIDNCVRNLPAATPEPTATPTPAATPAPTATLVPADTPVPTATVPTATPAPVAPTATPVPADTPVPTAAPEPTATPVPAEPVPTATPAPVAPDVAPGPVPYVGLYGSSTDKEVIATWPEPTTGGPVTVYIVCLVTQDSDREVCDTTADRMYTFSNVEPGSYWVSVVAKNSSGESKSRREGISID